MDVRAGPAGSPLPLSDCAHYVREFWAQSLSRSAHGRCLVHLHAPLMSYFAWGKAIAQEVSQDPVGTDLGDPGPTPRWGREGLQDQPSAQAMPAMSPSSKSIACCSSPPRALA
jgi:hypothetical protein